MEITGLPIELWSHIADMAGAVADVAALAATSGTLAAATTRHALRRARCAEVRRLMDEAIDAWEAETYLEWDGRLRAQECEGSRVNGNTCHASPGMWTCDKGTPDHPAAFVICGDCAEDIAVRHDDRDRTRWPMRRIDASVPHVGTFGFRQYAVHHYLLSHRLDGADGLLVVPDGLQD